MKRDDNAPTRVDDDRTVRGGAVELLRVERDIAVSARRARFRAGFAVWFVRVGAACGYVSLILEILRSWR